MKKIISVGLLFAFLPLTTFAASTTTPSIGSGPVHASVQIDGVAVSGVTGVQHLQADVEYYQNHKNVKNHVYSLTIKKTYSASDTTLSSWRKDVESGQIARKSVSVIFHNDAGSELARINFSDCFPTKWSAPDLNARNSAHATEKISLQCTQLSLGQ